MLRFCSFCLRLRAGSQHSLHPVYMVLRLETRVSCRSDNTLPTQLHSQSRSWFFKSQTKSKAGFSCSIHLNIAGKRQHNDLKSPLLVDTIHDILKFMFLNKVIIPLLQLAHINCSLEELNMWELITYNTPTLKT